MAVGHGSILSSKQIAATIVETNSIRQKLNEISKCLKKQDQEALHYEEWKILLVNIITKLIDEWRCILKSKKHDVI